MSFAGDLPAEGSGLDYSDIGAGQRKDAAQLPLLDSVSDAASHAFFGASRDAIDLIDYANEGDRARRDQQFNVDPQADPGGALIDPKEYQAKYQDLGLTFTPDMSRAQANLLINHRQDELHRQFVLDHSPDTVMAKTARGLTDFAVSALDPLNVAAAFVPGVGEARAGLIAARYGKTIGRIAEGAAAGATGMAALQPLQYAEAQAYQDHYGPMDAFMNVAFGAALGGGLHAGVGAISDFIAKASPETREAALRASVGQALDGRPIDVESVLATDEGLAGHRIDTATEAGPLTSLPVINHEDFALATREAQLQQDVATHDQSLAELKAKVDAIPQENPTSVKRLRDLKNVEQRALAEDLTPEARRALLGQRDQILTDTNPEKLQTEAQPTFDKAAAIEQRRGLQAQRDNAATMLEEVRSQRRQMAVLNAIGPYARSAIDRARQNSMDFARGNEPSTVAARPDVQTHADEVIKTGDDPKAELADAHTRLSDYKAQGILTDSEHTAFTDANAAADEAHKTHSDAADAAARCLFLHP